MTFPLKFLSEKGDQDTKMLTLLTYEIRNEKNNRMMPLHVPYYIDIFGFFAFSAWY